jgi:hypothetical protein
MRRAVTTGGFLFNFHRVVVAATLSIDLGPVVVRDSRRVVRRARGS